MLKLNRQTRLAILILAECARHPQSLIQTADAAKAARTSLMRAAGIVHMLMRGGLLQTKQGRRGGIRLTRPANAISLGDVVRVTETNLIGTTPTAFSLPDPIDAAFAGATSTFVHALDGMTIGDLARHGSVCLAHARQPGTAFTCPYAAIAAQQSAAALTL
ncbi:RrF2 family transcriptional regulator [Rhizobium sp. SYY.PMSO]|uniref:RrF2 family transcriptional regulator n=1 Tax=Rhizobium sp. SYY.PMSO TaxID=3382192 RepID=UPI00398FFE0B